MQNLNDWLVPWQNAILRASFQGAVALSLAWLLCREFTRLPAAARPWLWRLALLKMTIALLVSAPLLMPILPSHVSTSVSTSTKPTTPLVSERHILPRPQLSLQNAPRVAAMPSTKTDSSSQRQKPIAAGRVVEKPVAPIANAASPFRPSLLQTAALIWLTGLVWQAILLLRAARQAKILRRSTSVFEAPEIAAQMRELAMRLRVTKVPQIFRTPDRAPLLMGFWRPAILLPDTLLATANEAQLRLVLAHELAHLKRRDLGWNCAAALIFALFWFHPLVWMARREWRLAAEQACDELTVRATEISRAEYGNLLIAFTKRDASHLSVAAVGVSDEFSLLQRRLLALHPTRMAPRWIVALLLALGVAGLAPYRLTARAQEKMPAPTMSSAKLKGRVVDAKGAPVAGATVFAVDVFHKDKTTKTITKTDGSFAFDMSRDVVRRGLLLQVDGGTRGIGELNSFRDGVDSFTIKLSGTSDLRLRFLDARGRPVSGLGVRLRYPGALPDLISTPLHRLLRATNARGEVEFDAVPRGTAQITLTDGYEVPSRFGGIEFRSGKYGFATGANTVAVNQSLATRTIRLLPVATISGRVTQGKNGPPAVGVGIGLRHVTPAELRGEQSGWDTLFTARTNADGRFAIAGVRADTYNLWLDLDKPLSFNWAPQENKIRARPGTNSFQFALGKGAVIRGRVVSETTGKPVAGLYMGLKGPTGYFYEVSRADGVFQFRTPAGAQHLFINGNNISPPAGFEMPASKEWDFGLAEGGIYSLAVKLPSKPAFIPIMGRVLGPDGAPVAKAEVRIERLSGFDDYEDMQSFEKKPSVTTDENGHFVVPRPKTRHPVRLWARSGQMLTPRAIIALPGDDVTLQLAQTAPSTIRVKVSNMQNHEPIGGVSLKVMRVAGGMGTPIQTSQSDAKGECRFDINFPMQSYWVSAEKRGYGPNARFVAMVSAGMERTVELALRPASATLSGQVLDPKGIPAAGVLVSGVGSPQSTKTDASGKFFLPQVYAGKISVLLQKGTHWERREATGGQSSVIFRLNSVSSPGSPFELKPRPLKIGSIAPDLQVQQWLNASPLSLSQLRGKIVLLDFYAHTFNDEWNASPDSEQLAQSFKNRGLEVISIASSQIPTKSRPFAADKIRAWLSKTAIEHPCALDKPRDGAHFINRGETMILFGNVAYTLINRDGYVAYAGNSLDDALQAFARITAREK